MPCSFNFYTISAFKEYEFEPILYRGCNAVNVFIKELLNTKDTIMNILHRNTKMIMTDVDKNIYRNSTHCHICEKPLNGDKVRDHCHITGKFIGASHEACNVNRN